MRAREVFSALGRGWYILVVGLALTAGAGWFAYQHTPTDYTARSLVLLLPPVNTADSTGTNPFLQLGGLEVTARVLVATYSGTAFQDEIASRSPDAEVVVSMDESTQGGVIAVDVKDRGEKRTLDLLGYVTGTVSERLAGLQSDVGVDSKDIVRSMILAKDAEAKPDFQSLIRVLVLVVGGGVVFTGVLALVVDALLVRRRRGDWLQDPRLRHGRRAHADPGITHRTGADAPARADADDGRIAPDEEGEFLTARQGGGGRRRTPLGDDAR